MDKVNNFFKILGEGPRAERTIRVFENRVLRRIFVPKRDEVTGKWGKLHNDVLMICNLHPLLCG
jgi:hypothetical protein